MPDRAAHARPATPPWHPNALPDVAAAAAADCGFLVGRLIDEATLRRAAHEAAGIGVATHEVLISRGWIDAGDYATALAAELAGAGIVSTGNFGAVSLPIDTIISPPAVIADAAAAARARGHAPLLLSRAAFDWAEPTHARLARVHEAAEGLRARHPAVSAATPFASWQLFAAPAVVGIAAGGLIVTPEDTLTALAALVTLPFLFVVGLRVISLAIILFQRGRSTRNGTDPARPRDRGRPAPRIADADLPVYSIMVPLFREADVLPDIVAALGALDYPVPKLDILLVLERVDEATQSAARQLDLPANIRIVVVPDAAPRTKPKALNYAMAFARGDYIVVYDAEDEPEPDQLRLALAAFQTAPANVWCIQARLNIDNAVANWLTRQFTIEYSALFDALLPALVRLGLPIPLGGTSNHFPRAVLENLGGWDAHNVTEDADLGLRIARAGGRVAVLGSTTWEEAPPTFAIWLPQRTRWLKGFMQTWLVHMRQPRRLLADLGLAGFIGFQAFIGGIILSALIYPVFVVVFAVEVVRGEALGLPQSTIGQVLLALAVFNLVGGYLASTLTAGLAVARRGYRGMMLSVALMPLYWLLISLAAYRAVLHLWLNPHLWEKTPHTRRRTRRRPG